MANRASYYTKQDYIPTMIVSNYDVVVEKLEYHEALHMDAHMLFMKMQEEHPDIITAIMTQLSLKSISK